MKEIGQKLKEKREEMGITLEEASSDLNIDIVLIGNLEDGNDKAFKDILETKKTISNYTKYLGIDENLLLDMYNDYLFEKTSKISVSDIKEGLEKTKEIPQKIVKSPYTIELDKEKSKTKQIVIISIVLVIIMTIIYVVLKEMMVG